MNAFALLTVVLAATLQVVSGDNQTVGLGSDQNAFFAPVVLALTASDGTPIAHVPITVSCNVSTPLACRMNPRGKTSITLTTDDSGYALVLSNFDGQYASVVAYGGVGAVPLTASYGKVAAPVHLAIGSPFTVTPVDGNQQSPVQIPNSQIWLFMHPLAVSVTDAFGRPATSGNVIFTCTPPANSACVLGYGGSSSQGAPVSNGLAQSWLLPPGTIPQYPPGIGFTTDSAGTYTIVATYQGASATFTEAASSSSSASAAHGPGTPSLRVISGDRQVVGQPIVRALFDGNGDPISNATISVACNARSPLVYRMDPRGNTSVDVTTDDKGYAVDGDAYYFNALPVMVADMLGEAEPATAAASYQGTQATVTLHPGSASKARSMRPFHYAHGQDVCQAFSGLP